MEKDKKEINITVPESLQSPKFANIAQINVTDREVVIDFAFVQPNTNQGIMVSKIVLTPEHAKSLNEVLAGVLTKHYGEAKKI